VVYAASDLRTTKCFVLITVIKIIVIIIIIIIIIIIGLAERHGVQKMQRHMTG